MQTSFSFINIIFILLAGIGISYIKDKFPIKKQRMKPNDSEVIPTARSRTVALGETKSEIRARLDELNQLAGRLDPDTDDKIMRYINDRRDILNIKLEASAEDLFRSVVRSHEAVCAAKQMDERAAYGQDPAMYYTLAICGEAGEMGNKIVKALRNGNDPKAAKNAIMSELPDIFIYGAVLAYVLDIDLTRLVNEKVQIVIERADSGYYGGPLPKA
ncbi:MAG TPA: hypothetical protein VIE65_02715 [Methylobacter sp.]|jgi:NTP pyrophosphatase (non-canonical NTP hydrolase)